MVLKTQSKSWPEGRPMLPQGFVDDRKRERCARALSEIVHEVGVGGLTVSLVSGRARIARGTFYNLFKDGEEALLYACEFGSRNLREEIEKGAEEAEDWREKVESAIAALLRAAGAEPFLAELCLLHAQARINNPVKGPYDLELVAALADVIGRGRAECSHWEPASQTEELLASGILSIVGERLWRGEAGSLGELTGDLTALATTPFLPGIESRGAARSTSAPT